MRSLCVSYFDVPEPDHLDSPIFSIPLIQEQTDFNCGQRGSSAYKNGTTLSSTTNSLLSSDGPIMVRRVYSETLYLLSWLPRTPDLSPIENAWSDGP
jgi:hypothetical protein